MTWTKLVIVQLSIWWRGTCRKRSIAYARSNKRESLLFSTTLFHGFCECYLPGRTILLTDSVVWRSEWLWWPRRIVCPACPVGIPCPYIPDLTLDHHRGFAGPLGPRIGRPLASSYDEYLKAYSVAMLPGRERENLSYGGKSTSGGLRLSTQRSLPPTTSCHATLCTSPSYEFGSRITVDVPTS